MWKERATEMIDLAQSGRVVRLGYRKSISSATSERLVEPYNFIQGQEDLIVRCYQLEPEQGWRFFMLHKIDSVEDAGEPYAPRVDVTLAKDDLEPVKRRGKQDVWTDRVQRYRDLVSDAMADEVVTREELTQIRGFVEESGITDPERLFVHVSLFHRCLGAILEDGKIDETEMAQIKFLRKVFDALGGGLG